MFQRKFKALSGNKVLFNRRGQVSLLFALMMPIFLLMLGVVLDLGWYYLNVSRLQNAADAAAVAGAKTIINSEYFSDYKNIKLVGKYPAKDSNKYRVDSIYELTAIENTNTIAEEYVAKNLSSNKDNIINSWTKSEVGTEEGLYTKDNNLYYVVKLKEEIRHFFLPGWFDDMTAPVTAVALLSKTAIKDVSEESDKTSTMPTMPTVDSDSDNDTVVDEEQQKAIEKVLNENMIVGNWEVQNWYRQNGNNPENSYLRDEYGDIIADPETGEATKVTEFHSRFSYTLYAGAWNHFQDFYHHYTAGGFYRTQTISIQDDVVFTPNSSTDPNADINGDVITSYGVDSSVAATSASINTDTTSSAYNPEHKGARKTYKNGIGETGDVGYPYTWKRVDSLNADFKPEVGLSGKWLKENWDITLDNTDISFNNKKWDTTNGISEEEIKKLRIHSSINFDGAYQVRPGKESPDILWMRIESEPMLYNPDVKHTGETAHKKVNGLNSVNQIILNANFENSAAENYRPFIIFYDGPEYYETNKEIRASKPVILNLKKAWRGVLYAANSPVVVIGDARDQFVGFVVAKEYHRLADDNEHKDFVAGGYRYFDNDKRKNEYPENIDGAYVLPFYYLKTDTEKTTRYYKITDENGIEMFVDDRGDIATVKLSDPPTKYGEFSNFGRTDFTTHSYHVPTASSSNMLLSE